MIASASGDGGLSLPLLDYLRALRCVMEPLRGGISGCLDLFRALRGGSSVDK